MKAIAFWLGAVFAFGTFGYLVAQKERIVSDGRTVLLELAPRDPRSWMQGDYMVLRYSIAQQVVNAELPPSGHLIVTLDADDVATFVRVDRGEPLAAGELRLRYKRRGELRLGAESFFFEEGQVSAFDAARYGELRVDNEGNSVLIGLRDEARRPIGQPVVR